MFEFVDAESILSKIKVIILGSYIPENFKVLIELKNFLINQGFQNTFIGRDLVSIDGNLNYRDKMAKFLFDIKNQMLKADFNLFVFFHNIDNEDNRFKKENESIIVELMALVETPKYSEKENKTLVYFPYNYSSSMLEAIITQKKINIYEYQNTQQILQKSLSFIKYNL